MVLLCGTGIDVYKQLESCKRLILSIYLRHFLGQAILSLIWILVLKHVVAVLLLRVKIYVCAGSGAKVGSKRRICSTCGGRGQVMRTEQTPIGLFSQVSACLDCGGDGEVISEYCRKCSGEGRVRVKKSIKVKVPPRVSRGSILRVVGEGGTGPRGGPPGDLYVYLDVEQVEGI